MHRRCLLRRANPVFPLSILLASFATATAGQPPVNTLREVPSLITKCWVPPPLKGSSDIQITVLLSFKRSGELLGKPKVTFQSLASEEDQLELRKAAALAIAKCTPLPITDALGGAIAGRTFRMTFEVKKGQSI
jgi:hypothetical protein